MKVYFTRSMTPGFRCQHKLKYIWQKLLLGNVWWPETFHWFYPSKIFKVCDQFETFSIKRLKSFSLTHLFPMYPFSTPWKNQKTVRFSDVLRGYRNGALGTNGLKCDYSWNGSVDISRNKMESTKKCCWMLHINLLQGIGWLTGTAESEKCISHGLWSWISTDFKRYHRKVGVFLSIAPSSKVLFCCCFLVIILCENDEYLNQQKYCKNLRNLYFSLGSISLVRVAVN